MKYGFAGIGVILAGLFTLMGIYYVLEGTMINEEDYHGLKEAMEAAMIDAVDRDYYQRTGEIKIIKEKFVENFTRRFVETTTYGKEGYKLTFYDIIESPPKASVRVEGHTGEFVLDLDTEDTSSYDIINELDAILKYNGTHHYTYELYAFTNTSIFNSHNKTLVGIYSSNIKVPEEIRRAYNIGTSQAEQTAQTKCKIVNMEYVENISGSKIQDAAKTFKNNYNNWYWGGSQMVWNTTNIAAVNTLASGNTDSYCEIESVQCFEFTRGSVAHSATACKTSDCGSNDCLRDVVATFKNKNCMTSGTNKITGFKYRVTWECTQ